MEEYIDFVIENNMSMPEWKNDIERFSDLHSWYKHLGKFDIVYPLLRCGEEPRNSFDPSFTDLNQNNFHWTLVLDYNIDNYAIKINDTDDYVDIPDDLKKFMKQFPIYLNNDFGPQENEINHFFRVMIGEMCERYWNELISIESE